MSIPSRKSGMSRRTLLKAGAAISMLPASRVFAQSPEPLKIGFLTVLTGPLAAGGKQQEEGAALFLKERNGMIGGRKVELITQDTGGNPALAKTKLQELVERHKVTVSIGPLATNEAIAMDNYVRDTKVPLITTTSAATVDLKSHAVNPWVLHAFGTAPQVTYPLGDYAAKTLGYKKIAIVAEDFTYGHEGAGGFQLGFEGAGGKIVQKLWPPLNAPDYGSYIAQIKSNVDCLFIGFAGSNGFKFLKQYREYGGKLPILGGMTAIDESLLQQMGDDGLGCYSTCFYSAQIDTPTNKKFVDGMQRDYKVDPGMYASSTYTNGAVLEAALKTIDARIEDKHALIKALRENKVEDTARGPVRFDKYGNVIGNVYIRRVEKKGGRYVNAVAKIYPDVSQFWTYGPEEFLTHPVYNRETWPGSKNIEP